MDETESDGVGANTERTPLLGNGFGQANNCSLSSGIVGLTDISVEAGDRRDVGDGTVLRVALSRHEHQTGLRDEEEAHTFMRI